MSSNKKTRWTNEDNRVEISWVSEIICKIIEDVHITAYPLMLYFQKAFNVLPTVCKATFRLLSGGWGGGGGGVGGGVYKTFATTRDSSIRNLQKLIYFFKSTDSLRQRSVKEDGRQRS